MENQIKYNNLSKLVEKLKKSEDPKRKYEYILWLGKKLKEDGDNIAGYIANIKRQGGGKGPTAKQKKRMAEYILKELRK